MLEPSPRSARTPGRQRSDDQSLIRYWRVLRERVWLVAVCTAVVVVVAIVYVKVAPRTYQAQSEMLVQASSSSSNGTLAALPVLHQTGDPTEDVLTAASLVTTQPVAAAVVKSLRLRESPASVLGDVQATPIGQTGLVAVQATASSPRRAQQVADEFVKQTIALSTARMHAAIRLTLPTLQGQLQHVPAAQRYGPGSLGEQVDELQQLQTQNDPTLVSVAPATLPSSPSSPRTKLSIVAGLIGGLLVGVAAAFLSHAVETRLRREDQLRERSDLQILARIPRQRRVQPRPLLPSELSMGAQEGYRTLRAILAARSREQESRSLLVTGSGPSEGKSTTAIGLAVALAQGGAQVILIDADLRKPTLAKAFGLTDFMGTEDVLSGRANLVDALETVAVDDVSVRVLAARPGGLDSPNLLTFKNVQRLLEVAKAVSEFVVIDSAPMTAVIDALPFAQAADETLIVARMYATRLDKLADLEDLLAQYGVSRLGLVLIGESELNGSDYYYTAPPPTSRNGPRRSGANSQSRRRLLRS